VGARGERKTLGLLEFVKTEGESIEPRRGRPRLEGSHQVAGLDTTPMTYDSVNSSASRSVSVYNGDE
jgi:hypothetical protein